MYKYKKDTQIKKGFTLVETLIAVLILMVTVVAILTLVSSIIFSTKNQIKDTTAKYLLQEGLEYVRNNRDSALNGGASWTDFTNSGIACSPVGVNTVSLCECVYANGVPGECTIDPIFDEARACPISGCPNLILAENLGRTIFCTAGGMNCPGFLSNVRNTNYVRSVRLEKSTMNPEELFVNITVSWFDLGGIQKTKTLKTSLTNW
jgi:type II secretory pathway pseudopilin PulG